MRLWFTRLLHRHWHLHWADYAHLGVSGQYPVYKLAYAPGCKCNVENWPSGPPYVGEKH